MIGSSPIFLILQWMVFYRQYRPAPPLASLIECYWAYRCRRECDRVEPLIPGGRVELIFTFDTPIHWLITPETPMDSK